MANSQENNPKYPRNQILFGAPGTGKSYLLNQQLKKGFAGYERVTFHPDYSYAQFVGTYKPTIKKVSSNALSTKEYGLFNEQPEDVKENVKYILSVVKDPNKSVEDKYDTLRDHFNGSKTFTDFSRLPILLGIFSPTDQSKLKVLKQDRTSAQNSVQWNDGKALRKYLNLSLSPDSTGEITYEYVPGPFMRVYVKAIRNSKKNYVLVIEEINRANTAAVFGDIFQLLDRNKDGESEYAIHPSEDMKNYLEKELGEVQTEIKIPENMYIWATMNSADQGVFPMDTAFKRRWHFTYIGIDDKAKDIEKVMLPCKKASEKNNNSEKNNDSEEKDDLVGWNFLRKAINNCLAENDIHEDKQLGPFFIIPKEIEYKKVENDKKIDYEESKNKVLLIDPEEFKNKVLMYLFEDAGKHKRNALFSNNVNVHRFSKICNYFDKYGLSVFSQKILKDFESFKNEKSKQKNKVESKS